MNTLRKRMRSWLGIEVIESRANDAIALAQENAKILQEEIVFRHRFDIPLEMIESLKTHERRMCLLESRSDPNQEIVQGRLAGLEVVTSALTEEFQQVRRLHSELDAALQELRTIREVLSDPKKVTIRTTNSRQFRALIEQENTNGL